jgi:hypothetical protein
MTPNFDITAEERTLVDKIVERAGQMFPDWDKISLAMDVVATHNHACRLRLADLLATDDFNFAHDISGIVCKLDREKLILTDCFWPRFAAKQ